MLTPLSTTAAICWRAAFAATLNLGDGYTVGDCYWEVKMISDQTHDGIRELEFDAVCYVPKDSVGSFSGDYITNTDSELYDEYTRHVAHSRVLIRRQ